MANIFTTDVCFLEQSWIAVKSATEKKIIWLTCNQAAVLKLVQRLLYSLCKEKPPSFWEKVRGIQEFFSVNRRDAATMQNDPNRRTFTPSGTRGVGVGELKNWRWDYYYLGFLLMFFFFRDGGVYLMSELALTLYI